MLCAICGENLTPGSRTCPNCGTTAPEEAVPTASRVAGPPARHSPDMSLATLAEGVRFCPGCGATFGPEYTDPFCRCGVELVDPPTGLQPPIAPVRSATVDAPGSPPQSFSLEAEPEKPPPGTPCLVLYSDDKQPFHYFPLQKDALLIGRTDAVAGVFADIDLDALLPPALARKVSRRHALVLRQRNTGAFSLRPLAGNTGTQIDADMVEPQNDYPLTPGRRLILGGAVRLKFEVT